MYNIQSVLSLLTKNIRTVEFNSLIIMLGKTLKKVSTKGIEEYLQMVNSGEFYKRFYSKMYPDQIFNKADAKLIVLFILFSKNRTRSPIKEAFKIAFPEVYKLFAEIKKKNQNLTLD